MRVALSTIDNPYNPFKDFYKWLDYDVLQQHKCCELVARFSHTSDGLSDNENEEQINAAIDEIILNDPTNIFIKIVEE